MPKYSIGEQEFRTKTEAIAFVKDLLWKTPIGGVVANQEIMQALIAQHPAASVKLANGIATVEVHPDDWGSRGFRLRTPAGELISFSYKQCFNPVSRRQDIMTTLRREIHDQVNAFRFSAPQVCALTGVKITHERNLDHSSEVDHVAPRTFLAIANEWITLAGGEDKISFAYAGQLPYLSDPVQSVSWRTYHREHAVLRLLASSVHRSLKKSR